MEGGLRASVLFIHVALSAIWMGHHAPNMYITLEADYAVRIIVYLAEQDRRIDANSISLNTGVSLRFALKILRNLVGSGITKSFKGTQGGYELNRVPSAITLKDILQAVEGEYVFSRCLNSESKCTKSSSCDCKSREAFSKITEKVCEMLEEVKVSDLMRDT
ncbi:MAG: Rrf2 family transcriptional regulator [Oscillospiraceae bacterium]